MLSTVTNSSSGRLRVAMMKVESARRRVAPMGGKGKPAVDPARRNVEWADRVARRPQTTTR
jgi:hypothetical protein